jgi:hypothetical protein
VDVCADAHMACGCLVPLLADGVRRRKDAVVDRSGFSNKASSLPLTGQLRRMAATGQDSALLAGLPAMPDW